ncbi:hypothetical protein BAY61_00665 [Prauserella marina]|uniref:Uncharacterized conserved protein YndB, AHSA1/START domain n=1 Tax=Prauserella marina TaxID=530584 RepID=A0A222VJ48_9PSEU|nr:SRPBCC family protein [Prauserella marina]ASR33741.1 hypothetical protein BAY61_00665 [Prauserella marina]PWV82308.1 uncharacterized protein YndB with AHSA1/START domain [Prauserella marina]SDC65903.1 Uncharacterized conserved protein YndB, AHSA1/START domain [Prauserella marina]
MNIRDLGTLTRSADGRRVLTFVRTYPHPREKVWRALTEAGHLRGWFAQYLDYDESLLEFSKEGAVLEFRPGPGDEQPPAETGRVLRCTPPSLLEYTWGEEILRWELESAEVDGPACVLTFSNTFTDPAFAPFNALGWHSGLDRLAAVLDGEDPSAVPVEADDQAASELLARYEKEFA